MARGDYAHGGALSSASTGSRNTTSKPASCPSEDAVRSASYGQRPSSSTTITRPQRCAGCCASAATSPSVSSAMTPPGACQRLHISAPTHRCPGRPEDDLHQVRYRPAPGALRTAPSNVPRLREHRRPRCSATHVHERAPSLVRVPAHARGLRRDGRSSGWSLRHLWAHPWDARRRPRPPVGPGARASLRAVQHRARPSTRPACALRPSGGLSSRVHVICGLERCQSMADRTRLLIE